MKGVGSYVLLYGAYVAALHLLPGPWHRWKQGREGMPIDPWTGQHVLWGALAQRMDLTAGQLALLGALNEVGELWIRRNRPQWLWGSPESTGNAVVDQAANLVGWYLAQQVAGPPR